MTEEEIKNDIQRLCIKYMGSLPVCDESFGQDDNVTIGCVEVLAELYAKYVGFPDIDDE